ncbi:MAG TPA: DUF177 domain-containing protein [Candidatus Methylomirabilis sp.]|nr:DUF177 domain-containing protein [Candidatus Methylomirabilis sp.]
MLRAQHDMLIEVSRIPPEGLDVALPDEELDLGASAGVWTGPASVRADLHIDRSGRGLLISGAFTGGISLVCSRCLECFGFQAEDRFQVYCEAAARAGPEEEHELSDDELDVTYLEEGRINTDHLLRENILLSLPIQPLCREDCQGLCPRCGANLNQGACGCTEARVDPRLQVLRKLL